MNEKEWREKRNTGSLTTGRKSGGNASTNNKPNSKERRSPKPNPAKIGMKADQRHPIPGKHGSAASPVRVQSAEELKAGDPIVVTIKRMGINGEGVGYFKRKTVFVEGALPEETVKAVVTKIEPKLLYASAREWESRSPYRKQPDCPVFDQCGGCQLQHMTYAGQLKAKEAMVREAFEHYLGAAPADIRPILGMDQPWAYRNKAQLQVGLQGQRVVTGLYAPGSRRLVDISGCPVQHPEVNRIVEEVRGLIERLGIPIYQEKTGQGSLRTIVARTALETGKIQLTFVTATDHLPLKDKLVGLIRRQLPSVVTIAHNVQNAADSPLIFGPVTRILWGSEQLSETLGSVRFSLSPRAFFQLNPEQTVKLYDAVKEAAQLTGKELVIDAYCGTGTIALWLAPLAGEVRGIEISPEAVQDARANAERNSLRNVRFEQGKAEELLPTWVQQGLTPDVIVVDPPRSGCDRRLLDAIALVKPKRLVYVSCNPSTLAKDCRHLIDSGFRIESVQPVDMFPQTSHVECCSLLVWDGK